MITTTQGLNPEPQAINLLPNERERPLFIINTIISQKETISILTDFLPRVSVPSKFLGLCWLKMPFDEIVEVICKKEEEKIINEHIQEERSLLRSEIKRPWGKRTRRPFRGKIDSIKPTFHEKIELANKIVDKLGIPEIKKEKKSNRGKKTVYDLKKSISAIIVKGRISFEDLSMELKNISYDATLNGSKKSPGHTYLHELFRQIDCEYINVAMKLLDDMINELYLKFEEDMNIFVGDNSALTCETLTERKIAMETRLVREIEPYFALVRINSNSFRYIGETTNKIRDIMPYIPEHSTVLMDKEYDVDDNYWVGINHNINIHIKQKKTGRIRSPGRKKGKKMFNYKKYRNRKLGERPFGNIEKRSVKCYYKTEESRLKGCVLIGIEHNIIAWFKNKAWCDQFVELKK